MDTAKLMNYLLIIIDLEKDKYTQSKVLNKLKSDIQSYTSEYRSNEDMNERVRQKQEAFCADNVKPKESGKGIMIFLSFYSAFTLLSCGRLVYFITNNIAISLLAAAVGGAIGALIPVLVWKNILKKRRSRSIVQINRGMRADNARALQRQTRNRQLSAMLPKLRAEQNEMQKLYNLTCNTLKKCYDIDIIPVKYRSLVPVCMFYDYLLNKQTYSLERNPQTADEGAINMYEKECILKSILFKMDQILDRLNEISANQAVLYNAISEGNRQTSELLNNLNNNASQINSKMDIIQYQNQRRNACLEYMSYVTYQNFR